MTRNLFLLLAMALPLTMGCGDSGENAASPEVPAATLASLKQADLLDGKEDHVISKCYVCSLGMDGKPEFAVEQYGYTAHLCSEGCKSHFEDSADEVIASTTIPVPAAE
ncbi:hypothetical protein K227x_52950 [Rubripirellula lacrimiformis]|uniref:YHS domain protein n=1 Tax=Rubripirellula lacrimiformis TaxID=1930273 RepID=A0A517NIJ8_9BACT|nr:hypothetical protein [Rubripirellula lacrimiformis]QDT06873.1 hypothetical protein K227x_52950 [Rubripirellula lacrimiformis]